MLDSFLSLHLSMLPELHGYIDMNIYYKDDELRKQGDLLIGKAVTTGHEIVQGATIGCRLDSFKNHISADPIAMRLLYSIATKIVELLWLKRFEMNRLPASGEAEEAVFNSILRRTFVIKREARFVDQEVLSTVQDADSKMFFFSKI